MRSYYMKFITRTALLLALCVVVQQFKSLSQFITGPLVNLILIIAALAVGLTSGLFIAAASPILAFIISPSPIMSLMPQLIPVIIIGNMLIVLLAYAFREKRTWLGLFIGSLLKAAFLAAALQFLLLPLYGEALKEAQRSAITAMFSYNQLITALIASALTSVLWPRLKKVPGFRLNHL